MSYDMALSSGSMPIGLVAGDRLGHALGIEAKVGGVGVAVLHTRVGCLLAPSVFYLAVRAVL